MDNDTQRYYDPNTLNRWFTVSCVVFLVSLVAMFYYDYDREWRDHQATFREIDIRISNEKLGREQESVAEKEEYEQLQTALLAAQEEQSKQGQELDTLASELATITKERDSAREDMNFKKGLSF